MGYNVRQMGLGEILDESFKFLKDQFATLVGITAVLYVPSGLLGALMAPKVDAGMPQTPSLAAAGAGGLIGLFVLLVFPLTQMALTRAVTSAYLSTPIAIGEAYAGAKGLYGRYLGTVMLVGLALIPCFLLLFVPGIYFSVAWSLVGPILVVEGLGGRAAMKRSSGLVKGHWWHCFGVFFTIGLVSVVVSGALGMVLGAIPFLGPVLSGVVQAVAAAFGEVALVVLYVDLRCRKESFDLQRLASEVSAAASGTPVEPSAPTPAVGQ